MEFSEYYLKSDGAKEFTVFFFFYSLISTYYLSLNLLMLDFGLTLIEI